MNPYFKKLLARLLSLMIALTILPIPADALTDAGSSGGDTSVVMAESESLFVSSNTSLPDHEELFAAYAERMFYPDRSISVFGISAREQLDTPQDKHLYDFLKSKIGDVAKGVLASTVFTADAETLKSWNIQTEWTDDLGVDPDTAWDEFFAQFDTTKVLDALLHDCPYDFYWYDKTVGFRKGYGYSWLETPQGSIISVSVEVLVVSFSVADSYQAQDYDANDPSVNTAKTGAATNAAANAAAIVKEHAHLSDHEKLLAYRDEICSLVSYNNDATAGNYTGGYGDPWQLIYVFDGNPNTNVVCEGYSKAFQYLCDLSFFFSDIFCYTVTGIMSGGTGAGGHMWNIVTMDDGKNYLVDVTNSDAGTIGTNGDLFLAGTSGSINGEYCFAVTYSDTIAYAYDVYTLDLWGSDSDSILKLAGSDFAPSSPDYMDVVSFFDNKLQIEKFYKSNTVVLKISPKNAYKLPALKLYTAIYDSNRKLVRMDMPVCRAANGSVIVSLKEPHLDSLETYQMMLWTDALIPVIQPIDHTTGFFQ